MLGQVAVLLLVLVFSLLPRESVQNDIQTGFWYGNDRKPESNYETIPLVSMSVRISKPYQEGPGVDLVNDPFRITESLFAGNTIARQTFDTQFIQDMSYSVGIDPTRVYVNYIKRGEVHYSWESSSVIVAFYFLERNTSRNSLTLLEHIADLTNKIQIPSSILFDKSKVNVTWGIDPTYGLIVDKWDVSLRLTYAIEVVGANAVSAGYFLNQGARGICDGPSASNFSTYCEFERFFEDDVSRALNISYYRIQINFIKKASFDSVLVYFRITPPKKSAHRNEKPISQCIAHLIGLVNHTSSALYQGNVTIRTDPLWGVSDSFSGSYDPTRRSQEALFTYKYYEYDPARLASPNTQVLLTAYDRCKANHRCNWGIVTQDQSTNDVRYFQRLFDRGNLYETNLFLDFEDWRMGSRGFNWLGTIAPTQLGMTSTPKARAKDGDITGAHFWPFDQVSLGPDVPCYLQERNQGLVLNRDLQRQQIDQQNALVQDLAGRIRWIGENLEFINMDAHLRARKDVRRNSLYVQADFQRWHDNEVKELRNLSSSMCVNVDCNLVFDTSALTLTGAIGKWNGVIRKTAAGTEVAVFSFNSIYLGPEVGVTLVGQRAFALVSKTTAVINTTFFAKPGTIGGMLGGGNVGRFASDRLNDKPKEIYICDIGKYCADPARKNITEPFVSNNPNGKGSGNLRVSPFVVTTSAPDFKEIQVIRTFAQPGQTLAGGFQLTFKKYITPILPHDCSSELMKSIIESNLNLVQPTNKIVLPNRFKDGIAGAGEVTVSRSTQTDEEGYTWSITFSTAIGNIEQMKFTNYLQGLKAGMTLDTLQNGTEILGTFTLGYQGAVTAPILAAETAAGFKAKLLALPSVVSAFVTRTDPTQNCDDGLCPNGPNPGRGLVWTVYVTSNYTRDNVSPDSPTDPLANAEGSFADNRFTANYAGTLLGGGRVDISFGTSLSPNVLMRELFITTPFSLAFGGSGASYGGLGGAGYSENPTGAVYNDNKLTDLLGGSGGCMRAKDPFEINSFKGRTSGWGGHGGGAIEIVAANDIVVGTFGKIVVTGGDAEQSSQGGGGGGSGGAVLLAAGGSIVNDGYIDISGGDGGFGGFGHSDMMGGGGSGGRIALYAESVNQNGQVNTRGGRCGAYKSAVPETTLVVNVSIIAQLPQLSLGLMALDKARVVLLASTMINNTFPTTCKGIGLVGYAYDSQYKLSSLVLQISLVDNPLLQSNHTYNTSYLHRVNQALNATANLVIAQVTFLKASALIPSTSTYDYAVVTKYPVRSQYPPFVGYPHACSNSGQRGSFYSQASMTTKVRRNKTAWKFFQMQTNRMEKLSKPKFPYQ